MSSFLESLFKTPRIIYPIVSPDRKWVAWTWANKGEYLDVYIASTNGAIKPTKITDFNQRTSICAWSADSQSLVVHYDTDGDERYTLYKININNFSTESLIKAPEGCYLRGGEICCNGKFLVFGANYDFETKKIIDSTIIYRHNIDTGEFIKLAIPKKPAFIFPNVNIQGNYIIYHRTDRDPSGEQVWLVDMEGKEDKEILNFGDKVKISAGWHNNGEEIIFTVEEKTYTKVGVYTISNKNIRWILDDSSRSVENAWMPYGSNSIVIDEVVNAQHKISLINEQTGNETAFPDFKTGIPLAQISEDLWISAYYNSSQPEDLIIHSLTDTKIEKKIVSTFDYVDYSADDLTKAEAYSWKSIDGLVIHGWIFKPKLEPVGTIVLVHGGPSAHSEDTFNMNVQFYVSEGFVVFDPNYRGSTGYGLAFKEAIKEDGWGGREQDDIVEGIKSLIKDGISEPYKIGITGVSYGGYSAWCAITRYSKEYIAAAVPICGMTDLVVDYETTRPDLRSYTEEMMGGTPTQVPEKYYKNSPIHFVQNIKGKVLIIQGARDPNVTLENVAAVERELQKYNISYEKLIFDDEGHGIWKSKNQKVLLTKTGDFFKKSFIDNS